MNSAERIGGAGTGSGKRIAAVERCGGQKYIRTYERAGARTSSAPEWLVFICRMILRLTECGIADTVRAAASLIAVAAIVVIVGAVESGTVPFAAGAAVCAIFSMIALSLTRED